MFFSYRDGKRQLKALVDKIFVDRGLRLKTQKPRTIRNYICHNVKEPVYNAKLAKEWMDILGTHVII
jgi:hypothetical protein